MNKSGWIAIGRLIVILVAFTVLTTLSNPKKNRVVYRSDKKTQQIKVPDKNITREISEPTPTPSEPSTRIPRKGFAKRLSDGYELPDYRSYLTDSDCSRVYKDQGLVYSTSEKSEQGICHIANAFMLSWAPYKFTNPWLITDFVNRHVTYKFDKEQFSFSDIWQTGPQVYYRGFGDCEDHSIFLADWLSSLGYDARAVVGDVFWSGGGRHVWVALFLENKQYLIEATNGSHNIVSMETDYSADYMFNSDSFWVRTSSSGKRDYSDQYWRKVSNFSAYNNLCEATRFEARANISAERFNEAKALLEKITSDQECYAASRMEMGMALGELKQYKQAVRNFEKVPDDIKNSFFFGQAYGKILFEAGQFSKALSWQRKAEKLNDADSDLIFDIARTLYELRQHKESEKYYLKHLSLNPEDAATNNNLGVVYQDWGFKEKAILYYKKAVKLDPAKALYRENLENIERSSGMIDTQISAELRKRLKSQKAIDGYKEYLKYGANSAFALSASGSWGWSGRQLNPDTAKSIAVKHCSKYSKSQNDTCYIISFNGKLY